MKKITLYILSTLVSLNVLAQDTLRRKTYDQILPRRVIDLNVKFAPWEINQKMLGDLSLNSYNPQTDNTRGIGKPTYTPTSTTGVDLQYGYFFGRNRMFGAGIGLMYFNQTGNMALDSFKVQYNRYMNTDSAFRQMITATHGIKENVTTQTVSIPIVFKFKHQFSKYWGVTSDIGMLVSIYQNYSYSTNAQFNYEADYNVKSNGKTDNPNSENSPGLITMANVRGATSIADTIKFFNNFKSEGFNVGLNESPKQNSSTGSFNALGLGVIGHVALTYQLSYRVTLNVGGYFSAQQFKNNTDNWKLTETVNSYKPILSGISTVTTHSYGINAGLRYFFGGKKDSDGDGVPDEVDRCPYMPGLKIYDGCPDTDGDGIPDQQDLCPLVAGAAIGCPDRDGDQIADDKDDCPDEAGLSSLHGCPDRDGDGVIDKNDLCPDEPGIPPTGCPDMVKAAEKLGLNPQNPDSILSRHIVLSTSSVQFKFGQSNILDTPALDEAVEVMRKNEQIVVFVSGYTDDIGSYAGNMALSFARAEAVRKYMESKGIPKNRIIVSGYGKMYPLVENKNSETRAKNRRIEMKMLQPLW